MSPGSARTTASWSGWRSRCQMTLLIMPSVVSMPPDSSTAALDTTSLVARRPVGWPLVARLPVGGPLPAWPLVAPAPAQRVPGRVGEQRQARPGAANHLAQARVRHPERRGPGRALRGVRCAGPDPTPQPRSRCTSRAGYRDRPRPAPSARRSASAVTQPASRERISRWLKPWLNGARCRPCSAPIQRQHARPDHPGGGEPGVIDGERGAVAEQAQGQFPAGHQPSAEHRQPGDRLGRPQPGQHRVQPGVQVGPGDGRPEREGATAGCDFGRAWLGRAGHAADGSAPGRDDAARWPPPQPRQGPRRRPLAAAPAGHPDRQMGGPPGNGPVTTDQGVDSA